MYTVIQIPAVFLLGRRFDRVHLPMGVVVPFALLVVWLVAVDVLVDAADRHRRRGDFAGSHHDRRALPRGPFELRTLIAIVLVAMQPGLIASEWALQHEWARGVRTDLEGLGWDLLQPKLTRSARRHRDDRGPRC